ncbi:MAG TPA: efflux RND transporter periplasmic adaptor subunit [Ideonella sp.]|nr:efflux RND transporter periplasmic adaptor subunit [Ideonella sp.]
MKSPRSRWPVVALPMAALCAAALLAGCSGEASTAKASAERKAQQVGVLAIQPQRLAVSTELPGRTSARLTAEIRPQVGGIVQQRLFTEGSLVKAGQVLYQIDPASYQAAFASAQASVKKAESSVAAAQIAARRNAELLKIDAVSQQVNDDAQATLQQAQADLGVARAAQETARINLGFTRIAAPISGRIGLSSVTPGALVTTSQTTALATVQQLDTLYVDVTQSSAELLRLKREFASGKLKRSGENEARIKLLLEDGSPYPQEGRLTFNGVTVNATTGAITLRGVVPNPDGLLMPGMYVRAVLEEGVDEAALLVPQRAVTRTPTGGATALLVGPGDKVERRSLVVDRAVGNQWQVTGGLKAGERVLIEGSQRVKPGDTVQAVAMSASAVTGTAAAAPASAPASLASR